MDNKPAQNIQDTFLNTVRKDKSPLTIYLVSGVKLTGRIRSFDKYSVLLENNNQEQLIFKHAISTVVSGRVGSHIELRSESKGDWKPERDRMHVPVSAASSAPAPLTPRSEVVAEKVAGR
ncbi:MAG: RNA chaperone Hfq [Acidobacteriaceae bacterium]